MLLYHNNELFVLLINMLIGGAIIAEELVKDIGIWAIGS